MLVALLAVRNIRDRIHPLQLLLHRTQRCSTIRLKVAIASPLSKSAEIALCPSLVIAIV